MLAEEDQLALDGARRQIAEGRPIGPALAQAQIADTVALRMLEVAQRTGRLADVLAISLEEEDARIYRDLAEKVRTRFPSTASILDSMREEEASHRTRLQEFYVGRFGDHVLYVRRQDVKGFLKRLPLWLHP